MNLRPALSCLFAASLFAAGCSVLSAKKDPTRFYELSAATNRQAAASSSSGPTLVVSLDVAAYLQNPSVVERVAPNEVRYLPFDQWAGPISGELEQSVRGSLAAMTGSPVVNASQTYVTRDAFQVRIQLRRFDILPDQRVHVLADWLIGTNRTSNHLIQGGFNQERSFVASSSSLQPAIAALSELLGELCRAIAVEIR